MRRRAFVPTAGLIAGLTALSIGLFGCGGGTSTVTVTTIPDEIPATTSGTTAEQAETGTTASETTETGTTTSETTATEAAQSSGPSFFSTPSRNIGCQVTAKFVRCDIGQRTYQPNPPSHPCNGDYGNSMILDAQKADFGCITDSALGATTVLPYGSSAQRGVFRCDSAEEGITCSDVTDGHGFFLSKDSFRLF